VNYVQAVKDHEQAPGGGNRFFFQAYEKKSKDETADEFHPEYDLASLLKEGVLGKYAKRYEQATNLILLAPDVAKVFPTEEAVNEALRLVIKLKRIPEAGKRSIAGA